MRSRCSSARKKHGSTTTACLKYASAALGVVHLLIEELADVGEHLFAIDVGHRDFERALQRRPRPAASCRPCDRCSRAGAAHRCCWDRAGRSARSTAARARGDRDRRRTTSRGADRGARAAPGRSRREATRRPSGGSPAIAASRAPSARRGARSRGRGDPRGARSRTRRVLARSSRRASKTCAMRRRRSARSTACSRVSSRSR